MKYFIDFEAKQYTDEIISVGCVDEKGREFYTLVQPRKIKLTKFITNLTGITAEDLQNAPTVDEAFSVFYDWIDDGNAAEFYCYGSSDALFLTRTLKDASADKARKAIKLIRKNLIDFAVTVKKHFLIVNDISLKKIVEYYRKDKIEQSHNALEDAQLLKEIYYNLKDEVITECPFPDYQKKKDEKNKKEKESSTKPKHEIEAVKGKKTMLFPSYKKAAEWVMKTLIPKEKLINDKTKSRISQKIKRSIEKNEPYFGIEWRIHN